MRIVYLILLFMGFVCSGSAQITISASNTDGCSPLGVNIQVTSPDASTIDTYAWEITTPSGAIITASSPSYVGIFSESGTYDVSLTLNGTDNAMFDDFISVYEIPSADFVVNDPIGCFPFCVEYTDLTVASGGDIVEWSWDFGNGQVSGLQNPTICYDEPGFYTPLLSVEDEFGCYNDISFSGLIQVLDQFPTAEFTASNLLDCNAPVEISFENNSTGFSDLTSSWDFGDTQTTSNDDLSDVSNTYGGIGIYSVCLHIEDEVGCEGDSCQIVEIFDNADAEFSLSETEICAGQSIEFTNETFYLPNEFQWDFDGDGVIDSYDENPIFEFLDEGIYFPELTIIYSDNCMDTQVSTEMIEVFEEVVVDFAADTLSGCSLPFTVNFENLTTGAGNITYNWFVDGFLAGANTDFSYEFDAYGSYDIELVAESDIGCTVSLVQPGMIVIIEPTVTFTQLQVLCANSPVNLINFYAQFTDEITEWNWDFDSDGIIDSNLDDDNVQIIYEESGEYIIDLNIVSENGCMANYSSSEITVTEPITPTFTISETEVCAEILVEFCVDGLDEDNNASWNFGDTPNWTSVSYTQPCIEYHYADTGVFDVSLSVFSSGCGFDTIIESAIYIMGPVAAFNPIVDCDANLNVTFNDASIAADSLYWDFGDGSDFVYNDTMPTHTFAAYGEYEVTLYVFNDSIGCEDLTTIPILLGNANPEIPFGPTSGCPPLLVDFQNGEWHPSWYADFGNGITYSIDYNEDLVNWNVVLNDNGTISEYIIYGANPLVFPDIIYEDIGVYDVSITASDEFGCSQTIVYEDAIEVSSNANFATFQMIEDEICDEILLSFLPDSSGLVDFEWTFSNDIGSILENPQILFEPPYDSLIVATLSAMDADGCASTVTQEYELTYPPEPAFTMVNVPSCIGDTLFVFNESEGDIVSYSWDFGDPASGDLNTSTEENPYHVYYQDGDYDICLSVENSIGCVQTFCFVNGITIDNPEASFTFNPDVNNCLWGVQFNNTTEGTIACSQWDFGDDQTGSGISPFHTYPIGVYDVQLIVCNDLGCQDTILVEDILNYGNVIGPFTQEIDDTPCAPFTINLEAFNTFDFTFDYFWDFDDGFGDPVGGTTTTHDYLQAGVYCPSLIMTDPSGCPVLIECPDSIYVEEFTLETTDISELCFGDSLLYTVDGGQTYEWEDETFLTAIDEESFWLHPNETTDYVLNSTFDDCETAEIFTLVVHELPIVTLEDISDICFEDDDFLLEGGLPNDIPGDYYVNGILSTEFLGNMPPDLNYEIEYIYTDEFGCVESAEDDVFVFSLPNVVLESIEDMCENDEIFPLDIATPTGGEYLLGDSIVSEIDPALIVGEFDITYTFIDANGCINDDMQSLLVSPVPIIDFELGPPCEDEEVIIDNHSFILSGSIDEVNWDFGPGGTSEDFNPLPFSISNSGIYDIEVEMTSDNGCANSFVYEFQIFDNPEASFESVNVCQFEVLELNETSTSLEGVITDWTWLMNDDLVLNGQDFDVTMTSWGDYNITLIVESEFGCVDSLVQTTEVYPAPEVDFSANDNCLDEITFIVNQTTIPETSINEYNWSLGDGTFEDEQFGIQHIYTEPGTYEIILEAVSQFDCSASDTSQVIIYPIPVGEITSSEDVICQFGAVDFEQISSVVAPYTIEEYGWYINDSYVGNEESLTYYFNEPGSFDIEFVVTTDVGCSASIVEDNFVLINPTPEAGFQYNPYTVSITNPLVTITDDSQGADDWYYEFGDGSSSIEAQPTHIYTNYTDYVIIQVVTNEWGCSDTAYHNITVEPDLLIFVPNAFTPNMDGVNELFVPVLSGFDVQDYEFQVFDRWGEKLFYSQTIGEGWNGSVNQGEYWTMDGVYTWLVQVRIDGEAEITKFRGSVMIIR